MKLQDKIEQRDKIVCNHIKHHMEERSRYEIESIKKGRFK